jgi:hypothetical protein
VQQWERDRAALAKERKIRRQECLDHHNEDYRLCEQQSLSPSPVLVNSSLDEEESEGERTTYDSWEPAAPPSPGAEGAAAESTLEKRAEPLVTGSWAEAPAGTEEALVGAVEAPPSLLLTVYNRIKLHMDLQADKSPVIVKGPFFPRVVNPSYRICGTMCKRKDSI